MEFSIKSGKPEKQRSTCLVLGICSDTKQRHSTSTIDSATQGLISKLIKRGDASSKPGQTLLIPDVAGIAAERLLLVGCGSKKNFDLKTLDKVVRSSIQVLVKSNITEAGIFLTEPGFAGLDMEARVAQIVISAESASYHFDQLKTTQNEISELTRLSLLVPRRKDLKPAREALRAATAIAAGVTRARDLGNLPGNICTPTYLASEAKKIARKHNMTARILSEKDMEKLGMDSLLSVSRGSRQSARLIILEHQGGKPKQAPVVLVGKGLTFDAGGISLKPAAAMDEMKYDMCGGASVLGTMQAVGEMQLPLNVIGIVPSSENLPDGDANKPGDIVTSMSGQTIEILNTDAEGRLILCDALTYAERYKPAAVIDIATLTGACVVALGEHASGLFSSDEKLVTELLDAGSRSLDRAWQLPLWDEYDEQLKSNFADMANIGGSKAGAVTAACFLSRYTKKYPWAHLDIAGTAWLSGPQKGATGRPVPLLCQFLRSRASGQ